MADVASKNLTSANLELQKLKEKRPSLAAACSTLSATLPAIFNDAATETPIQISQEDAQKSLRGGVPLLRGQGLNLNEAALKQRWMAICAALQQEQSERLAAAVRQGRLNPAALLQAVLAEGPEALPAQQRPWIWIPRWRQLYYAWRPCRL